MKSCREVLRLEAAAAVEAAFRIFCSKAVHPSSLFPFRYIWWVCPFPEPKTYLVESEMQSSSRNFYVNWHIKAPLAYNQAYLFHF